MISTAFYRSTPQQFEAEALSVMCEKKVYKTVTL